jgi:hypothetical protein
VSGNGYDRRERWLREVLRSVRLHPQTKLALVVLYKHMRDDGKVSVSRETVARELGLGHVRRVSERLTAARDAGFLVTVVEGSYGRTATWQAVFPDDVRVRGTSTLTDAENPHPYNPVKGAGYQHPITKANPDPVVQEEDSPNRSFITARSQPPQTEPMAVTRRTDPSPTRSSARLRSASRARAAATSGPTVLGDVLTELAAVELDRDDRRDVYAAARFVANGQPPNQRRDTA